MFQVDLNQITAHRALRTILASYLSKAPEEIFFDYLPSGKPIHPNIFFNLSHTSSSALIAVSTQGPVGVDIEYQRTVTNLLGIAERFFARAEYEHLASLSGALQNRAFFEIWTAKEALIKAKGLKLSENLNTEIVWPQVLDREYDVLPLPLAGEGFGEGLIAHLAFQDVLGDPRKGFENG